MSSVSNTQSSDLRFASQFEVDRAASEELRATGSKCLSEVFPTEGWDHRCEQRCNSKLLKLRDLRVANVYVDGEFLARLAMSKDRNILGQTSRDQGCCHDVVPRDDGVLEMAEQSTEASESMPAADSGGSEWVRWAVGAGRVLMADASEWRDRFDQDAEATKADASEWRDHFAQDAEATKEDLEALPLRGSVSADPEPEQYQNAIHPPTSGL